MPNPDDEVTRLRRLVHWLSLTYGENVPVFHGVHRAELESDYLSVIWGEPLDDAPASHVAARPAPAPDEDWGDQPVEHVQVDSRGNTVVPPVPLDVTPMRSS